MKLSQRIKQQSKSLTAHQTAVAYEWHKLTFGSKVATACMVGGCTVLLGLWLKRLGFTRARRFYTMAALFSRVGHQFSAQALTEAEPI